MWTGGASGPELGGVEGGPLSPHLHVALRVSGTPGSRWGTPYDYRYGSDYANGRLDLDDRGIGSLDPSIAAAAAARFTLGPVVTRVDLGVRDIIGADVLVRAHAGLGAACAAGGVVLEAQNQFATSERTWRHQVAATVYANRRDGRRLRFFATGGVASAPYYGLGDIVTVTLGLAAPLR